MKRQINALLALTLTFALSLTMIPTTAQATGRGPCSETRYEVDRQQSIEIRHRRVRSLIRCVFDYLDIPGEIPTALYVVERESGFTPWATNPVGPGVCRPWSSTPFGSCGLAQHLARYWPGRAAAFLPDAFFPAERPSVLQARANVWAMGRMIKRGGWGPWSL
jgi:hypothetical protein